MIYKLKQADTIHSVAEYFGYEDYKQFFKTMRYVGDTHAWQAGSVISCPSIPEQPRDRPYDGQPHTDAGVRGMTFVEGLTMRDVADCFNRAFALATGMENPSQYSDADDGKLVDLYTLDLSDADPGAIIQNAMCEIERMMGIFPNLPNLKENKNV